MATCRIIIALFTLCFLLLQKGDCQIYGFAREVYAAKSTVPIKSISVYNSISDKINIRKPNPNFNVKKMYLSSIEKYNNNDQLIGDVLMKRNGEVSFSSIYEYDDLDRIIGIRRYSLTDSIYIKKQYLKNQIIEHYITKNKLKKITIQTLNDNGNIIKWLFLEPNKDTLQQYQYTYDNQGNETSFILSYSKTGNNYTIKKQYDSLGHLKKYEQYDSSNNLTEEIFHEKVKESTDKNTNLKTTHFKLKHLVYEGTKVKKYETESIFINDKYNNTIKYYTNNSCGIKANWSETYLDIEY